MRIRTEIVHGLFIVTCEGTRLDATFAKEFFKAMQGFIQNGHVDIILDLSTIEFIDSTGLGTIVRCLKEIDGRGQLVLCGVSATVLSLLELTRLDNIFIRAATRKEALDKLKDSKNINFGRRVSKQPVKQKDDSSPQLLEMEEDEKIVEVNSREKRKHRRIDHKLILDEDIVIYCTNISTGKHSTAILLNVSPGGFLFISPTRHTIGDEFVMEGTIGKNFKFKERAAVRSIANGKYGSEFIKPSENTTSFLNQLTGAVGMEPGKMRY